MQTRTFSDHLHAASCAEQAQQLAHVFADMARDDGDHHEAAKLRRYAEDKAREHARHIGRICDAVS